MGGVYQGLGGGLSPHMMILLGARGISPIHVAHDAGKRFNI